MEWKYTYFYLKNQAVLRRKNRTGEYEKNITSSVYLQSSFLFLFDFLSVTLLRVTWASAWRSRICRRWKWMKFHIIHAWIRHTATRALSLMEKKNILIKYLHVESAICISCTKTLVKYTYLICSFLFFFYTNINRFTSSYTNSPKHSQKLSHINHLLPLRNPQNVKQLPNRGSIEISTADVQSLVLIDG